MNLLLRLLMGFAVILIMTACSQSKAPVGQSSTALSLPLSNTGRWITDKDGRVVILHGMNMVNKRAPYAPDAVGFADDDAAFLAEEGYNAVRVGVIYKALEPMPGVYDDKYLSRIENTVAILARHGIVSLLDFHQDQYSELFQGEGFPDWAVIDDGLPNITQLGYFGNPALERSYDNFWNNTAASDGTGLQDHYAAAWKHVAERFRNNQNILGYELFNEPWAGTAYPTCIVPLGCPLFDETLTAFNKRTIAAIRQADPVTLVWYEANLLFNFGPIPHLGDTGDQHAGFAFHSYCIPGINVVCSTFFDLEFAEAEDQAARNGDALLITEAGAVDDADILQKFVDKSDAEMVGWLEWDYCSCNDPALDPTDYSYGIVKDPAKPLTGDNIKPAKLAILSRPYPKIVAGTPKSYSFDASSKVFKLDYSAARADGSGNFPAGSQTVVGLPPRQYPNGYTVQVNGARVVSKENAAEIILESTEGSEVQLSVEPAQ